MLAGEWASLALIHFVPATNTWLTWLVLFDVLRCPSPKGGKTENGRKATSRWFITSALRATASGRRTPVSISWKSPIYFYHHCISCMSHLKLVYSVSVFASNWFCETNAQMLSCWTWCFRLGFHVFLPRCGPVAGWPVGPCLKPVRWHVQDFQGRDLRHSSGEVQNFEVLLMCIYIYMGMVRFPGPPNLGVW